MPSQHRKCRRIEDVQRQLHRRAEAELARLERALEAAAVERRDIFAVMNNETFAPVVVAAAARRLRVIDEAMARLRREADAQRARTLEAAMRLKHAERLAGNAGRQARAQSERSALDEALEAAIARGCASFPPA